MLRAPIAADIELLEDRTLLATFTVDNLGEGDDGDFTAGNQTLREAINRANATAGPDDINFSVNGTIMLTGGQLPIDEQLSIDGGGTITVNGTANSRIFSIAETVPAVISGLTITNGMAGGAGGGILVNGSLVLIDSTVSNNTATGNGGGIAVGDMGTLLDIDGSTVSNNTASGNGGGIAVSNMAALLEIDDSTIFGNTGTNGGGIASNDAVVTIDNTSIDGNTANNTGGGLNIGTLGDATLNLVTISGNTASQSAAIHNANILSLTDADVAFNNTTTTGGTITQTGNTSTILIERVNVDDNTAAQGGGLLLSAGTATVIDSAFERNGAGFGAGGAIFNEGGNLDVSTTTFDSNDTVTFGGAVHTDSGITRIRESSAFNNFSTLLGGGFANIDGQLFVYNSTISNNAADRSGGGVSNDGGLLRITNSTITGNRADANGDGFGVGSGGGVYSPTDVIGTSTTLHNTIVIDNFYGLPLNPNDVAISIETNSSNNLIGTPGFSGGLIDGINGNIVGDGLGGDLDVNLVLNTALAFNGGPTLNHALVTDSPAIDAGNNAQAVDNTFQPLGTDQRLGLFNRIQDGDSDGTAIVDIGAIEEQGVNYIVDTLSDGIDGDTSPGNFSLREALLAANSFAGPNTILFDPSLTGGTILLSDGVLNIMDDLDIIGLGQMDLTISGAFASHLFSIDNGVTARIESIELADGLGSMGGAIFSDGADLTVLDVWITNNMASDGGAIFNNGGTLTVDSSRLDTNDVTTSGGAIANLNNGTLRIIDSTFTGNIAQNSGGAVISNGDVTVHRSTFVQNNATLVGGALSLTGGTFSLVNSTLSQNSGGTSGGGLFMSVAGTITNSTIAFNNAESANGGGIDTTAAGTLVLNNSIVAGNTMGGATPDDIDGTVDTANSFNNLIGDAATSGGLVDTTNDNIVGVGGAGTRDVTTIIEPLADNGGPTMTHALVAGSVAIDAGDDALAVDEMGGTLTTDQRGGVFNRLRDGDLDMVPTVDIGAIEFQGQIFHVDTSLDGNDGIFTPGNFSLREAIDEANATPGLALIFFAPILDGETILLTDGSLSVTDDVEIFGLGQMSLTVSGGNAFGIMAIADGVTAMIEEMTFINGNGTDGGAIAKGDGDLTLNDVTLIGNDASGAGGTLFNDGGTLTLNNVTIQNSTAQTGGGIANVGGDLFFNSSSVAGSTATLNGGGILTSGLARTYIDGSIVTGNSAGEEGGGLWNSATSALIVINGSVISGNTASGNLPSQGGGGVFNDGVGVGGPGGRLLIASGATISGNIADGLAGSGGGILSINGVVTVDDSTISGNLANRAGGGIEVVTGIVELRNTNLAGNTATGAGNEPGNGGGLHVTGLMGQVGYVRIFGGTVSNNTAALEGGGLWNQAGNIMVVRQGAVIDGNTASGDAAHDGGGGIFNNNGRLAIGEGATISNNLANGALGSGGGVFSTGSSVTIDNSIIADNAANRAGGGIEVVTGELFLTNVLISGNDAGGTAPAPGNGGGLHISSNAFVRLDGGIVIGNTAASEGGGLWNSDSGVLLVRRSFAPAGLPSTIREATGPNAASIQATVDQFRNDLGMLNANDPGTQINGRRQINWDGAPDSVSAPNSFPGNFFNADFNPRARGIELSTPGTGFQLSATAASGEAVEFANINATYETDFDAFSAERLFTALDSNTVIDNFFVPGTNLPALTRGFGVVFSDVDIAGSTTVEYFDINGNLIATRDALATPGNGSQSFVGVLFDTAKIAQVKITSGEGSLSAGNNDITQGGTEDLVVMDDFIFAEPIPVGSIVQGNTASGDNSHDGGGGIFNDGGRLAVFDSLISNNLADGTAGSGGGILSLKFGTGGVTVDNSVIFGNTAHRAGGGIEIVDGAMILTNTDLIGNDAGGMAPNPGNGGGLHVTGTSNTRVTILGGTISGNTAAREGGGLWHQTGGVMVIRDGTTIDGNSASGDAADDGGGGIFNNGGRLAIGRATISNNTADGINGAGGGILSLAGGLTLDNSTVSGNSANGNGGGVANLGAMVAANATIAFNRSDADGVNGGSGGGLFNGGSTRINNTLLAGNLIGAGVILNDLSGSPVDGGSSNNLISDSASAGGLMHGVNGNIVGNNGVGSIFAPNLIAPLGLNGGPTATHALIGGTVAIDAGNNAFAEETNGNDFTTDQRGVGFPRINNGTVDIGAFEV